jgi:hypothetical protein
MFIEINSLSHESDLERIPKDEASNIEFRDAAIA